MLFLCPTILEDHADNDMSDLGGIPLLVDVARKFQHSNEDSADMTLCVRMFDERCLKICAGPAGWLSISFPGCAEARTFREESETTSQLPDNDEQRFLLWTADVLFEARCWKSSGLMNAFLMDSADYALVD